MRLSWPIQVGLISPVLIGCNWVNRKSYCDASSAEPKKRGSKRSVAAPIGCGIRCTGLILRCLSCVTRPMSPGSGT